MSAWEEVLSVVKNAKYIYEFDLKGFFDNVDCVRVLEYLNTKGLTPEFCDEIQNMTRQPAKMPKEAKLPEFDNILKTMKSRPGFKEFYHVSEVGKMIDKMMDGVPTLKESEPSKRYSLAGYRSKP